MSATVNGEPSTSSFRGFAALLQPGATVSKDQVKLMAYTLVPGGPGTNPSLSYSVAVCGSQPFQGTLLIGGDARLSNLRGVPALGARTRTSQSSFQDIPDIKLLDESTGNALDLGRVQAVQITMPSPVKCLSPFSDQQPFPSFEGQGQEITGEAAAPVQRGWRMGW